MTSIALTHSPQNLSNCPLPQQEGLDKKLVLGTLAAGVLFGVPTGLAYAIGYTAAQDNVGSRWDRFKSFVGKAAAPIITLANLKSLTNFNLISSTYSQIAKSESDYKMADINHGAEKTKANYDIMIASLSLYHKLSPQLVKAMHERQSAVAATTAALGIGGSLLCLKQSWNAMNKNLHIKALGWLLGSVTTGVSSSIALLKNHELQKEARFWELATETNSYLDRAAQATGLTASLFSAYKTANALKENKILEALQWFSLSMCAATLTYAASKMPAVV